MLQKNHGNDLLHLCATYDLMTNSVKFMQQTSSSLSEGNSSVCS